MGERIQNTIRIIRFIRRTAPKYSFEHAAANVLLGIACMILTILGEYRLWLLFISVLFISLGVQGLRVWWVMRRRDREYEDRLRLRMREDADA